MTAMPSSRAILIAAAAVEGGILATFGACALILLGRHVFVLPSARYGVLFLPQIFTAVACALIAAHGARGLSRGRALRAGLGLSLAGLVLLIAALPGRHKASVDYPVLLVADALVGAGFGLVYPALTVFAMDANPMRSERSLVAMNLALGGGMVVSPAAEIEFEEAGVWWIFPGLLIVLAIPIMIAAKRSRLGPDAERASAVAHHRQRLPAGTTAFTLLALIAGGSAIMLVAWSQARSPGSSAALPAFRALVLAAFWAALVVLSRVAFAALERRRSGRRTSSVTPFLPPVIVTCIGLASGQDNTTGVGIYLLAAVTCAAFLPLTSEPGHEKQTVLWLALAVGFVGLYPLGLSLAGPSLRTFQNGGAALAVIFFGTGALAVVACLICAGMLIWRGQNYDPSEPSASWVQARPSAESAQGPSASG